MTENIAFARRQAIDIDKMHLTEAGNTAAARASVLDKNWLETRRPT